jgi:hypothetical protein
VRADEEEEAIKAAQQAAAERAVELERRRAEVGNVVFDVGIEVMGASQGHDVVSGSGLGITVVCVLVLEYAFL